MNSSIFTDLLLNRFSGYLSLHWFFVLVFVYLVLLHKNNQILALLYFLLIIFLQNVVLFTILASLVVSYNLVSFYNMLHRHVDVFHINHIIESYYFQLDSMHLDKLRASYIYGISLLVNSSFAYLLTSIIPSCQTSCSAFPLFLKLQCEIILTRLSGRPPLSRPITRSSQRALQPTSGHCLTRDKFLQLLLFIDPSL